MEDENKAHAGKAADVEFEDSPFGKQLATRAADGIRGAAGCYRSEWSDRQSDHSPICATTLNRSRDVGAPSIDDLLEKPVNSLLGLFAASLGEDEDSVTATIGDSLYVRYANDLAVLKITCQSQEVGEVKITFQHIHPDHGPIDTASFTQTETQKFSAALERLEAYRVIWFA